MSSSDPNSPAIPLAIATDPDAWITIFDGYDEIVPRPGSGNRTVSLPRGIYTVRCERAGQSTQQIILHTEPRQLSIQPPPVTSAAPVEGASTTHEYYHYPSVEWSVKPTAALAGHLDRPGWLFIFIRAWDEDAYEKGTNLGSGFELVDARSGERVADFGDPNLTARDEYHGFAAFSASISPGIYVLRYAGREPWAMPIHVALQRSTQVFVLFHRRPLVDSIRVFFRKLGEPFRPEDTEAIDVDLALTGLSGGPEAAERAIPRRRLAELLRGKFEDPMVGLLGAHWLLSRADTEQECVDLVLNNLKSLLPGSPDVAALEILAATRWDRPLPAPVAFPPMLSAGLRALLSNPDRHIEPDSFLEKILVRLRAGSPWVVWSTEGANDTGDQWVQRVLLQAFSNPAEGDTVARTAGELRLPLNVVSEAFLNLHRSANSAPVTFVFADSFVLPDVAIEVGKAQDWTSRAALLLDEPFPRVTPERQASIPLSGALDQPIVLSGRNPVIFESRAGEGGFIVFEDRQLLLAALDRTGVLAAAIPPEVGAGNRFILFRWNFSAARAIPGDLGLGTEGPAYSPPTLNYALAYPVPEYWGAHFALDSALKHWKLPIQIQGVDNLAPGQVICADLPGSFQLRVRALVGLHLVNAPGERGGRARVAIEVASSVAGVFRMVISRQSTDSAKRELQVRLFESPGAKAPVVSTQATPIGSGGESAWDAGQQIPATVWPELRQVAARAGARAYTQALSSHLSHVSHGPLIACELDFAERSEGAAAQLRDLLEGVFDRNAAELSGELITSDEEGPAVDVRVFGGDESLVELGPSGDITLRPPGQTRSAIIAKVLDSRVTHSDPQALRTTVSMAFSNPSPALLWLSLRPLLQRFSPTGGAGSDGQRVEALLSGLRDEGANVTMAIDLEWPRGIESSWLRIEPWQAEALKVRLRAEVRFWRPVLALTEQAILDFDYGSAFLVYGALPPGFNPRKQSMGLSFPVLDALGKSLIDLLRAGDHRYTLPGCLEQAGRSAIFRNLLEFEDRVCGAASLRQLLSIVGDESEALQTILFGGGAMQLTGNPRLEARAAITLNLLRRSSAFPPAGFPLHVDPPLSDVIAQLRLQQLIDALKPTAVAAASEFRPTNFGEPGATANYAGA